MRLSGMWPAVVLVLALGSVSSADPAEQYRPEVFQAVAFTPDGKYAIAAGKYGWLERWDLATGRNCEGHL